MTQPQYPLPVPPGDPLLPGDFQGWFSNVIGVLQRSGLRMAGAMALWMIVPAIGGLVFNLVTDDLTVSVLAGLPTDPDQRLSAGQNAELWADFGRLFGVAAASIALSAVLSYFTAAGWAAMLRLAITDAAGRPMAVGDALRYGARYGLRMWGWYLLVLLCVLVGLCLCVLPGAYLAVVFSLFAPVVVCEGGPAMARSLRLVHRSFGPLLGRVALLFAAVLVLGMLASQLETLGQTGVSTSRTIVSGLVGFVVELATMVFLAAGLLISYVEGRLREGTLGSTAELLEHSPS